MRAPEITLPLRERVDEDGAPVHEFVVAGLNDPYALEADGQSLVGRIDKERGAAQAIAVESPLELSGGALKAPAMVGLLTLANDTKGQLDQHISAQEETDQALAQRLSDMDSQIDQLRIIETLSAGNQIEEVACPRNNWFMYDMTADLDTQDGWHDDSYYQPTIPGIYLFQINAPVVDQVTLLKNDEESHDHANQIFAMGRVGNPGFISGSVMTYMNGATDYVRLWFYSSSGRLDRSHHTELQAFRMPSAARNEPEEIPEEDGDGDEDDGGVE